MTKATGKYAKVYSSLCLSHTHTYAVLVNASMDDDPLAGRSYLSQPALAYLAKVGHRRHQEKGVMMVCGRGVLGDGKYTHLAHL